MKKIFLIPVCLVCIVMVTQAQNKEMPDPPPPPKPPQVEKVEFEPPIVVPDNGVNVELHHRHHL